MSRPEHPIVAVVDVVLAWALVGISHMGLVEVLQALAALLAIVYTVCRIVLLFKHWR